jgi:hypothetical protein
MLTKKMKTFLKPPKAEKHWASLYAIVRMAVRADILGKPLGALTMRYAHEIVEDVEPGIIARMKLFGDEAAPPVACDPPEHPPAGVRLPEGSTMDIAAAIGALPVPAGLPSRITSIKYTMSKRVVNRKVRKIDMAQRDKERG